MLDINWSHGVAGGIGSGLTIAGFLIRSLLPGKFRISFGNGNGNGNNGNSNVKGRCCAEELEYWDHMKQWVTDPIVEAVRESRPK